MADQVAASVDEASRVRRQYLESEQRFRALLESLPKVAVQGYDRHRRVIYWNEASTHLYGYTAEEVFGRALEELIIPDDMRDGLIAAHRAWIEEGQEIPAEELELRHRSGELVPVFSHHVMLNEHTDEPLMFCVDVDLSEQKQAHRELDFARRFDRLTQLPNREYFEEQLSAAVKDAQAQGMLLVLVYLDIDRFVEVNDTLGYQEGDRLLLQLATRLDQGLRCTDLMSRASGDEFLLAFPGIAGEEDIPRLVLKVQQVLRSPFALEEASRKLTACLGVSVFPTNGESAAELIRSADVAKNRAKLKGRGEVVYFDQRLHDELLYQHRLSDRLERAVEAGELMLHYQPQVSAASGRLENLEALLRWYPADGPPVSPTEFIPLAERSGLIHRIGDWVMEEACRQRAAWRKAGLEVGRIDINFSGSQMNSPDLFARLDECLERFALGPRDIGLELTENVLIDADQRVLEGLQRLYHRGFRIAIDDFGTGYSSLSYLKRFPVTALKIDRAFVRDAPTQPEDRAIMEATVFIGHRLGLEVVAEGVEDLEQLTLIREMRCDLVQGFYFFAPMAPGEIERLVIGMSATPSGLSS
ncbi:MULTISPECIES: EAL domain-containing protein [unclassified Halomonas]|uniref:putative bifunctional diguanylate cyclase/phosphodiesterase n=1 Tax=unclassified Halomonas TaxID=2609666 RepID=UPI002884F34E|nr:MULTISPECIES: EAL domain-containing protein [unclassified Halomonas]MDT0510721.1 EAL domain-containing protein [Halomonas sp. LES1]MDT0591750.1 EAL domain-containing protein [Halomonas sp. PAR8]